MMLSKSVLNLKLCIMSLCWDFKYNFEMKRNVWHNFGQLRCIKTISFASMSCVWQLPLQLQLLTVLVSSQTITGLEGGNTSNLDSFCYPGYLTTAVFVILGIHSSLSFSDQLQWCRLGNVRVMMVPLQDKALCWHVFVSAPVLMLWPTTPPWTWELWSASSFDHWTQHVIS